MSARFCLRSTLFACVRAQVSNEPLPQLPVPADLDPTLEEYVPDTIDHDNTFDDTGAVGSTRNLMTHDVMLEDKGGAAPPRPDGSVNVAVNASPKSDGAPVPAARPRQRYSMRRECCKHLVWPCWWAYARGRRRPLAQAAPAAEES